MRTACVVSVELDHAAGEVMAGLMAAGFEVVRLAAAPDAALPAVDAGVGVTFRLPPAPGAEGVRPAVVRAHAVWEWCRRREFDLVCYPDRGGAGHFLAVARRLGLDPSPPSLLVYSRGPTSWCLERDGRLPGLDELEIDHMERTSVAHSDVLVAPTRAILRWMDIQQWRLPESVHVALPSVSDRLAEPLAAGSVHELAFTGGIERRSGLVTFVQALRRVPRQLLSSVQVTLNGAVPPDATAWQPQAWLQHAMPSAVAWAVRDPDSGNPLGDAGEPGRLVVLPADTESLPRLVRACLERGIPFLACETEETRALVRADDHDVLLPAPTPPVLAEALTRALVLGVRAARPADEPAPSLGWCASAIDAVQRRRAPGVSRAVEPLPTSAVSVVLTHRNRPDTLGQALDGLRQQTAQGFEVVLVDDGSDLPEAHAALDRLAPEFTERGWRIIRQDNRYLGAARNAGWRAARGQYVLFHDDDNVALPDAIARLAAAALHSGAAIITSAFRTFAGEGPPPVAPGEPPQLFVGGGVAAGLYANVFGDAQALVRRDVLERLGGFTEEFGTGHEDWELFARAALAGFEVVSLPEPLYWYRVGADSMLRMRPDVQPDLYRSARPYVEVLPAAAAPLALAALGGLARAADVQAARREATQCRLSAEGAHGQAREADRRIREALSTLARERADWRAALAEAEDRITQVKGDLAAVLTREAAARAAVQDLRRQLQDAEDVLQAERRCGSGRESALRAELMALRQQAGHLAQTLAELHGEIHSAAAAVARSRSMRVTRPLRNAVNRARHRPEEIGPFVAGETIDQLRALIGMLTSRSWELLGPARLMARLRPRSSSAANP